MAAAATSVPGAGTTAAVVLENVALVALKLEEFTPPGPAADTDYRQVPGTQGGETPSSRDGAAGEAPPSVVRAPEPPQPDIVDLENRVAAVIMEQFPFVVDVRFARAPAQKRVFADLVARGAHGASLAGELPRLAALAQEMARSTPLVPMPGGAPVPGGNAGGVRTTPGGSNGEPPGPGSDGGGPPGRTP